MTWFRGSINYYLVELVIQFQITNKFEIHFVPTPNSVSQISFLSTRNYYFEFFEWFFQVKNFLLVDFVL